MNKIIKLIDKNGNVVIPNVAFNGAVLKDQSSFDEAAPVSGMEMFAKTAYDASAAVDGIRLVACTSTGVVSVENHFNEDGSAANLLTETGETRSLDASVFKVDGSVISLVEGLSCRWNRGTADNKRHYLASIDSSVTDGKDSGSAASIDIALVGSSSSATSPISIYYDGQCNLYQSSDERIKDIDSEVIVDPKTLKSIRKIWFRYKGDPEYKINLGVTAQSVEQLFPEIVSEDDHGVKSVAYDKLAVIALSAIDSMQDEIDILHAEISEMRKMLEKVSC